MSSGIQVDQAVISEIADMKLKKIYKWLMCGMSKDLKSIVMVDSEAYPEGSKKQTRTRDDDKEFFDKLVDKLKGNIGEPRYIIYDFGFPDSENKLLTKLAFIFWCDDSAKVQRKMVYAASKDAFKKTACVGIGIELQGNDIADLDYDAYAAIVEKKK